MEKFIGDGFMATFNNRGDQPDHAQRASCAALALQREVARLAERHPGWPAMRVGVNSGGVVVREVGGEGHVAYPFVGDTVNTGARLEGLAPVGGVLIGVETYRPTAGWSGGRGMGRTPYEGQARRGRRLPSAFVSLLAAMGHAAGLQLAATATNQRPSWST